MADDPVPPPDHTAAPDDAVAVTLICTGSQAEVLRTLALLEGRTPEEVALDHIAGGIPLDFPSSLGEDAEAMATLTSAMFDGPPDLAAHSGKDVFDLASPNWTTTSRPGSLARQPQTPCPACARGQAQTGSSSPLWDGHS